MFLCLGVFLVFLVVIFYILYLPENFKCFVSNCDYLIVHSFISLITKQFSILKENTLSDILLQLINSKNNIKMNLVTSI